MSTGEKDISPDEAKNSLDVINNMHQVAKKRTQTPRWFVIANTVLIFSFIATIPEEGSYGVPWVLISLFLFLYMSEKRGVKRRYSETFSRKFYAWFIALMIFFLCMVLMRRTYGIIWAPFAGGLLAASFYYVMCEVARRKRVNPREQEQTL